MREQTEMATRWGRSQNAAADEARNLILDAAATCFERLSVSKTTVEAVAREAKVTRTTVYRYFKNRDAIVIGVMLRDAEAIHDRIIKELDHVEDFGDFLVEALLICLDEARERPLHITLFAGEASNLMSQLMLGAGALFQHGLEKVIDRFEKAEEAGLIRDGIEAPILFEWVVRIFLSFAVNPSPRIRDEEMMRQALRLLLLSAIMKDPDWASR